jgi:hypothetical protein
MDAFGEGMKETALLVHAQGLSHAEAGEILGVSESTISSTAVAEFAQLLRGGKYTGSLSFKDVIREAQSALGEDPYGYRAEFVELVRRAQDAAR